MSDDELRAEIARQIQDRFATLAARLRESAQEHGPVVAKAVNLTADEIERSAEIRSWAVRNGVAFYVDYLAGSACMRVRHNPMRSRR